MDMPSEPKSTVARARGLLEREEVRLREGEALRRVMAGRAARGAKVTGGMWAFASWRALV